MKDPVRRHTKEILSKFKSTCQHCQCFLINKQRQMYVLHVKAVFPEKGLVRLQTPGGRNRPLDLNSDWKATLRFHDDIAKLEVDELIQDGEEILAKLRPDVIVFTPRSTVRLKTESRSPVYANFEASKFAMEGELLDLSLGGAQLSLDLDPDLEEGDFIYKFKFYLRGIRIFMPTARVAHLEKTQFRWNVGLAFDHISDTLSLDLQAIIDSNKEKKLNYLISVDG